MRITVRNEIKTQFARRMRRKPTAAERAAWEFLRDRRMLGLKWRRQQVIVGFIADFYCHELHLALELDGPIHETPEAIAYDRMRDRAFLANGVTTIRLRNEDCTRDFLMSILASYVPQDP